MSNFNINIPGKESQTNLNIKNQMDKYDLDPNKQLYGGVLHDPRETDGLLNTVVPSDNKLSLLYTRDCHPKYKDGPKYHDNNYKYDREYTYDMTCLQKEDKDITDVINEIDDDNLNIHSKNIHETVNNTIIFDTNTVDSVKGNFTDTMLSFNYMSRNNSDAIQDIVQYKVYKELINKMGQFINIGRQSSNELFIIMRSVLLQYGDMTITNKDQMTKHILYLNDIVINYCVNNILEQIQNYNKYIYDKSVLPIPIKNPVNTQYNDILTKSDVDNYSSLDIDPLAYYPGFNKPGNNNLKTSIVDYNKYV
jgi:hypothetical protein